MRGGAHVRSPAAAPQVGASLFPPRLIIYSGNGRAAWGAGAGECKGWRLPGYSELFAGCQPLSQGTGGTSPKGVAAGDREMHVASPGSVGMLERLWERKTWLGASEHLGLERWQ